MAAFYILSPNLETINKRKDNKDITNEKNKKMIKKRRNKPNWVNSWR